MKSNGAARARLWHVRGIRPKRAADFRRGAHFEPELGLAVILALTAMLAKCAAI